MDQFLIDVRAYADAFGVKPSTVVQRATKLGGAAWSRWESRTGWPTLKTSDEIYRYIDEHPAPEADETALVGVG
jgi:hypothetical protein